MYENLLEVKSVYDFAYSVNSEPILKCTQCRSVVNSSIVFVLHKRVKYYLVLIIPRVYKVERRKGILFILNSDLYMEYIDYG